jgi:Na+/phosphate symporter
MPLKELISEMHDLFPVMAEGMDLLQKGLIYNNLKVIDEAVGVMGVVRDKAESLTEKLLKEQRTEPMAALYVSVPGHIRRLQDSIERIASTLRDKVKDGILFSDRALSELNFLFEKTKDIMANTKDMLLARNTLIADYIKESEESLARAANDFSTRHEERLIEGLCLPRASSVYLGLLDAFKGISWHSKEIARELLGAAKAPSPSR